MRIGVNTGEVVAAWGTGSGTPVTGDAVNVAAQLHGGFPSLTGGRLQATGYGLRATGLSGAHLQARTLEPEAWSPEVRAQSWATG